MKVEHNLTLAEIAELGGVSRQTPVRWALYGILVNGVRKKLRSWKVGGRRFRSEAAFEEFIAVASEERAEPTQNPPR